MSEVKLRDRENEAAKALEAAGVMLSRPGEDIPESGPQDSWGVCVGSHGGYGKTLAGAMRRCLNCCGIGDWWCLDHGEGELMATVFERISKEHLGRALVSPATNSAAHGFA